MSAPPEAGLSVDVIVDNYEYGRFLAAAIESALAQTHPRTAVIVVDDGSTDCSREVLEGYADRVRTVRKPNGGQASAMNAGLERSEADLVIFLDADDLLEPDAAARAAAAFAANPELVKLQSRLRIVDAEGRPTGTVKPADHLPLPQGDVRREELSQPFDLTWMATSGNAFRANALRRIFPIPEGPYRVCADWYLVHLTALLGEVASSAEVGASYRQHGANNYEPQQARLDLGQIRATIGYAESTAAALLALAAELGLPHPDRILSLADLANRMVSLRLDPAGHPVRGDGRLSLLADAVRACRRRRGLGPAMALLYVGWFAALAAAPRRLAEPLANAFLFPERRAGANRLLGRLRH